MRPWHTTCPGPCRPPRAWSHAIVGCSSCRARLSGHSRVSADPTSKLAGKKKPELKTCNPGSMKFVTDKEPKQPVETDQEVIFTYDVLFQVRGSRGA